MACVTNDMLEKGMEEDDVLRRSQIKWDKGRKMIMMKIFYIISNRVIKTS